MAKIVRRFLICIVLIATIMAAFQWKNYQKKSECRKNALLYFHEEDYQKAIDYLEEGLAVFTLFSQNIDKDMSCYLAESYYQFGETDKAVKLYDELIEKNPKEPMFYLMKGDSVLLSGDVDEAVKVFDEGWKKTQAIIFLTKICDSYIDAKDYENALIYAEKGTEINGQSAADFLFKEIIIYEKNNQYQKAFEIAEKYITLYPEDERGQKEYKFLTTRI